MPRLQYTIFPRRGVKMSKETQQDCLVKLFKAEGMCERELRLDKSGRPVKCDKQAFAQIEGGQKLCKIHIKDAMDIVENSV